MTNPLSRADAVSFVQAAQDPTTPPSQLAAIAEHIFLTADPDYERPTSGADFLRDAGRQGPLTALLDRQPPSLLTATLLSNPNTPQEHLLHFAADVPEAFLNNPILLLLLLEHPDLFRQMDPLRLLVFLASASIPKDLLGAIQTSATETILDTLRLHVSLRGEAADGWPAAAQHELERLPLPGIDGQQALIEHLGLGTIPAWLLDRLNHSTHAHIQAALHNAADVLAGDWPPALEFTPNHSVYDPTCIGASRAERRDAAQSSTPAVLRALADDDDPGVRARVAQNPHTPLDLLPALELADEQAVRIALARNPNTPLELLEKLACDYSFSAIRIRLAVIHHPNVTPAVVEKLASDESIQVRNALVRLPQLPPTARQNLLDRALTSALYSHDPFFHWLAMANPHTNPGHLQKGVRSPYWRARYALANNPAASSATLAILAQEGNVFVRAAARQQLSHHTAEKERA
ncbi:MAG: hypothetical protein H0T53_09605 [Herpetosiphonaceae bacterium]|nr:hypothetical protein [Herpetosiphonaceae bacterium]